MTSVDFEQELDEIEKNFDAFSKQFRSGENSDFSLVYQRVAFLLEAAKKSPPSPQSLNRLKILGEQLAQITQDVQNEMNSLQVEMSQNNHRFKGLQAYARQKTMGGT